MGRGGKLPTICAGLFPGEAPQKTQITVLTCEGVESEFSDVDAGFKGERPWGRAVESMLDDGKGDAPPDAIVAEECSKVYYFLDA